MKRLLDLYSKNSWVCLTLLADALLTYAGFKTLIVPHIGIILIIFVVITLLLARAVDILRDLEAKDRAVWSILEDEVGDCYLTPEPTETTLTDGDTEAPFRLRSLMNQITANTKTISK